MKLPSAEHPISISPLNTRLIIKFKDVVVAQSDTALTLEEAKYPAVFYVPRSDIYPEHFLRTEHSTYCPYKGAASYFSLLALGETSENAVWSYEDPYPAMAQIKDHVAFYADRVTVELESVA
jgi:uncharacterized protein (DUF427 family)